MCLIWLVRQFADTYASMKRSRRSLDFSDLEQKALDLLLGKSRAGITVAADEISRRYREIMVDEYQDSNGVQDAIFSSLTAKRGNCFLVGDVKQSIYQFRLADPGIFLEKYKTYVDVEDAAVGQERKVLLSHNFRSGPEVIEAVNDVFTACMRPNVGGLEYGEGEALREWISKEPLQEPAVELHAIDVQEETYPEEAAYVADQIHTMLQNNTLIRKDGHLVPVTEDDIVILLRSPGSAARYFQQALESRGIRCSSGNGTDLLQTQEISTVRAFLQTILNPRLDIPLLTTLASPIFGFTADDLAVIRANNKNSCFYDALLEQEDAKSVHFLLTLSQLRTEARMNTLTGLLEKCFTLTHLDSIYRSMPGGEAKAANLQTFYQLAIDFEKGTTRDVSQFLEHLDALESRGLAGKESNSTGCITIMSIHKSKGLEFPVVFLCNLSRKFNQENLRAPVLCDKELGFGLSIANREKRIRYPSVAKKAIAVKTAAESVSEEMRVLYVALTRPKDRLIMTYASRTLEADLQEVALRMDLDRGELVCRDAICLGDWVLLAALKRTEAGALHVLGARPMNTHSSTYPWKICVAKAASNMEFMQTKEGTQERIPEEWIDTLKQQLSFSYAHKEATKAPSKQTATDRKGRQKDAEAAEDTAETSKFIRAWRKPSFVSGQKTGTFYGNAVHAAMQHIRFANCATKDGIEKELHRLMTSGFITSDQWEMLDSQKLFVFFNSEIGRKLCNGATCLREFKFSILDDGENYGTGLQEEQVLLQGVIDCAVLEEDGILLLDFKTDRVSQDTIASIVEKYRPQLDTYAHAVQRIYEMPVKQKLLYFFSIDQFVTL